MRAAVTETEFPSKNCTYLYPAGNDLSTHREYQRDDDGNILYYANADGTLQEDANGDPIPAVKNVISKWFFSDEELDFINKNRYIYLDILGGQPPVRLIAGPVFPEDHQ